MKCQSSCRSSIVYVFFFPSCFCACLFRRRKEFFSLTKKSRVSRKSEKQRDLLRWDANKLESGMYDNVIYDGVGQGAVLFKRFNHPAGRCWWQRVTSLLSQSLGQNKKKKRVGNSFHQNTSHLMAQSFWVHCNLNLTPPPKQIANLVAMEFFAQGDKEDEKSSKSNPL